MPKGKHGCCKTKGQKENPLYTTWRAMHLRCYNVKHRSYPGYGGKGVIVCERWHTFANFLEDLKERPPGMTLGRSTPFSNYSPGEVQWETIYQQNKGLHDRSGDRVTVNGITKTKRAWAKYLGIKYGTLLERTRRGWGLRAYTTPAQAKKSKTG